MFMNWKLAESSQRGASSGAHTHVVFGRNEPALGHYHRAIRRRIGLPVDPEDRA